MTYCMTINCFEIMPPVACTPGMILGTTKKNCAVMQGMIGKKLLPWIKLFWGCTLIGVKVIIVVVHYVRVAVFVCWKQAPQAPKSATWRWTFKVNSCRKFYVRN